MAVPILTLLGLGSSAASAWVGALRPWLIGATVLLLAVAFFYAYVRRPSRKNKVLAWVAVAASALFIGAGLLLH